MTPTAFTIALALIAFVTSLMAFSEKIASNSDFKFLDHIGFKILILMVVTVTTIICTKAYNDYTEGQNQSRLNIQILKDSTNQRRRDSTSNAHLDSVIAQNEQLLINSNIYYDSVLKIYIRDSAKSINNYGPEPVITTWNPAVTVDYPYPSKRRFLINFLSQQAPAEVEYCKVGIAVTFNEKYNKMSSDTVLQRNTIFPLNAVSKCSVILPYFNNVSRYFFHVIVKYKKRENKTGIFETVVMYSLLNNESSEVNSPYKEQIISLFQ